MPTNNRKFSIKSKTFGKKKIKKAMENTTKR
jgi:hypothetical protein